MSKILIWETLSRIGGGQEMTLKIADILKNQHELLFLIPEKGELSEELEKRNINYTLMGDQSMPKGNKGIKGLVKFFYLTLKTSIKGRKIIRAHKPDIIYAPGPAALAWSAMCGNKTTKVVWHLHHIFESGATLKLLNILAARKCVKRIISVSDFVASQVKNEKAENKKITVYNPVESADSCVARFDLCNEYENLRADVKIGQIGFITPTKKQDFTLEVLRNLNKRGFDASLAILGSVPEGDEWYKDKLEAKVADYGLKDKVVFTGYRTDVMQIISTFDVVIVPSVEGFSLVAAQAILNNVPVLCADYSGCTEIIRNTDCGMIYSPSSDVSVVADTLLKTIRIDVQKQKEKHPEFLFSECSFENFAGKINMIFS